ncbi:hypothetical protein CHS0354_022184, partial [Potamilus streckersoni]
MLYGFDKSLILKNIDGSIYSVIISVNISGCNITEEDEDEFDDDFDKIDEKKIIEAAEDDYEDVG